MAHSRSNTPLPGDRAEMPNGEVGTVIQVLSTMKRRNGREVSMLQVATANGPRIWASDDLASLARDLPSKVNPVEDDVVATTTDFGTNSFEQDMDATIQRELDEYDERQRAASKGN